MQGIAGNRRNSDRFHFCGKCFRRDGTRIVGPDGICLVYKRREDAKRLLHVLVAAEAGYERVPGLSPFGEGAREGARGGGIVRTIHNAVSDPLEASRPDDGCKPRPVALAEYLERGKGRDRVLPVEGSGKGEAGRYVRLRCKIWRVVERGVHLRRAASEDVDYGRLVRTDDDGDAGLDYARLLRCDLLLRVAQPVAMVEAAARDDAKRRGADVRRVEASAQTRFKDGEVDIRP